MAAAGHLTTVKITGTSTAFAAEAFSVVSATVWQMTDVTKRILDPAATFVFRDSGAVDVTSDVVSIDPLFGTVTFGSPQTPGDADGDYLPSFDAAEVTSTDVALNADMLDTTVFASTNFRLKIPGLQMASGTIASLDDLQTDIDPGGGTTTLLDIFQSELTPVFEIDLGGTGELIRIFALIDTATIAATVEGLSTSGVTFQSNGQRVTQTGDEVGIAFGT